MITKEQLETKKIMILRYRYEPHVYKNISCRYNGYYFYVTAKYKDNTTLSVRDRRSRSNREACKNLYHLLER